MTRDVGDPGVSCTSMTTFKYRPEIDGLRAIAVVLVILFHAGLGFSGGFVGVDVFFVISGFLITGLILKEQDTGTFSLRIFWVRRIRRIVPAATLVVGASLAAGGLLLLPDDYGRLAESAIAQQLLVSNVFFWRDTGYFVGPAELKPLLHTWSLAVEEQFYLGYPFLLLTAGRLGRRGLGVVLAGLTIASFFLSQWAVYHYPSAAFYLLPTRAWELSLGALLWFVPGFGERITARFADTLSWLACLGILVAAWLYDGNTPFPGVAALAPCGATALFIYANSRKLTWSGRLLASRPLVFVGLISYSLYLWHWPILAFLRYGIGRKLPLVVLLSGIAASFAFACLSYRFVETPFRKRPYWLRKRRLVAAACGSAVLLLASSYGIVVTDGARFRLPDAIAAHVPKTNPLFEFESDTPAARRGEFPIFGPVDRPIECLIWGDSHALPLAPEVKRLAELYGIRCAIAARSGIVPLCDVWRQRDGRAPTLRWTHAVLQFAEKNKVDHVILAARWSKYLEVPMAGACPEQQTQSKPAASSAKMLLRHGLDATVRRLQAMGSRVWLIREVPLQPGNPRLKVVKSLLFGLDIPAGSSKSQHLQQQAEIADVLGKISPDRVTMIDPCDACLDGEGYSRIGDAGGAYYWDFNHLSSYGTRRLLRPLLDSLFAEISSHQTDNRWYAADKARP